MKPLWFEQPFHISFSDRRPQIVHLHRNLNQKKYKFALGIDPTTAVKLFNNITPNHIKKGQFLNAKAGSILDANQQPVIGGSRFLTFTNDYNGSTAEKTTQSELVPVLVSKRVFGGCKS